jgi:hypothetical protein
VAVASRGYLDEQAYRFINREDSDLGRFLGALSSVTSCLVAEL